MREHERVVRALHDQVLGLRQPFQEALAHLREPRSALGAPDVEDGLRDAGSVRCSEPPGHQGRRVSDEEGGGIALDLGERPREVLFEVVSPPGSFEAHHEALESDGRSVALVVRLELGVRGQEPGRAGHVARRRFDDAETADAVRDRGRQLKGNGSAVRHPDDLGTVDAESLHELVAVEGVARDRPRTTGRRTSSVAAAVIADDLPVAVPEQQVPERAQLVGDQRRLDQDDRLAVSADLDLERPIRHRHQPRVCHRVSQIPSRPWAVSHPLVSGPLGTMPEGFTSLCTT